MVMTLYQFSQIGWREACKKVNKAVVYIDNEGAECLHWSGGLTQMIAAGAVTVKEFSAFEVWHTFKFYSGLFVCLGGSINVTLGKHKLTNKVDCMEHVIRI